MLILVIFLFLYFFMLRSGTFKQNGSTQKESPKIEEVTTPPASAPK